MLRKGSTPETAANYPGGEKGFNLALPMTVLGCNDSGRDFEEETILDHMNYAEASFKLKNAVTAGTPLKLVVNLPPKLSEGQDLRLVIRGTVASTERAGDNHSLHQATLKLGARYVIKPDVSDGTY